MTRRAACGIPGGWEHHICLLVPYKFPADLTETTLLFIWLSCKYILNISNIAQSVRWGFLGPLGKMVMAVFQGAGSRGWEGACRW